MKHLIPNLRTSATALVAALATAMLLGACGGGSSDSTAANTATQGTTPSTTSATATTTLADTLKQTSDTQTMALAVGAAGLTPALADTRSYTLLMPNDAAMSAYGEDLSELSKPANRAALQRYISQHMVDGTVLSARLDQVAQASANGTATTTIKNVLGEDLEITSVNGVTTINGATITKANIQAGNGVMHVMDKAVFQPSIFAYVRFLPFLSTLEAAVRAAELVEPLRGNGPLTVFAPTNEAFDDLLKELNVTAEQLLANKPLLTQVLTYHVIGSRVLAQQIEDNATATTLQGQKVTFDVTRTNGRRSIEIIDERGRKANVVLANIPARNGVVHLIDRVILPKDMTAPPPAAKTIVEIAVGTSDFSTLVAAVQAAGLVDTLNGAGPFTVLAPTNAAFAKLLADLNVTAAQLLANKELLTTVLTYHVLPGRVLAADITNGLAAKTVQGQPVVFAKTAAGGVQIKDASGGTSTVTATDVLASNGVIHVIDRVILPASKNIVQLAVGTPQLSILVEAVIAAGLADALSAPGPLTVFAPTNDAFVALLAELRISKQALLANRPLLTSVLTYHVVNGQVLSSGIPFGQPVPTLEGDTLTIGRDLKITDTQRRQANIIATDIAATNGVVHLIDRVILPH
jgi:transforming growth factor-beta-induced protein